MYITRSGRGVFSCLLLKIVRDQKEDVKTKNPLIFRKEIQKYKVSSKCIRKFVWVHKELIENS
jgi:hypothetical protein